MLSLVLSGGNDDDVQVGALDPGPFSLGLEDHAVNLATIGEQGGQTSLGQHHLPDYLHEGQAVSGFSPLLLLGSSPVVPQGLAHNTS